MGCGGMVAASQPLAVAAGLVVLQEGGSAADAAVATAAALNVTEPCSTGLGGDAFSLYYEAKTRNVTALNGCGRAAVGLTLERLRREGFEGEIPHRHAYNVTVPGACAAWCDLVERHGRLSLSQILAPAIELAEQGFPVSPLTADFWQRGAVDTVCVTRHGSELLLNGRAPMAGEIFRNAGLANTLKTIAVDGKEAFYGGGIAEAIAEAVQAAGGCLTVDDLAQHYSTWEEPISTVYRRLRVWECPPNGQGLVALLALNLLAGFDLAALPPLSPERLHLEIEALRLAFADARYFVADPTFAPPPLEALLSESYTRQRRHLIQPQRARPDALPRFLPRGGSDTVYLSVVDGEGNACSFINSNYNGFGSGIVPPGCGFSLQNRGANFNLQPGHPNALAPGKRPYHTIIPALATDAADDALYACFGVMGGFMQPQGHVQVISAMIDDGLDPQSALDRLRFCLDVEAGDGRVMLEEGIPQMTRDTLARWGHPLEIVRGKERAVFGRGQIICRHPDSGVLTGGSDPRADGCAMSLR